MKKIGLLGGMSWVSTIDYYRFINEGINSQLGGHNYAECIIYSLNHGDIHSNSWTGSFELLLAGCESLKRSGAEAIALCANTAHLFADRLQEAVQLPFIHIGTATANAIKSQGLNKVALLGTKFTMEMDFYRQKLESYGLEVVTPATEETRDYIQYVVKDELGKGIIKTDTKARFLAIAQELIDQGAQGIILGCTEIPLLISQDDFTVPVFDTTKIHSDAIVAYALS